jgi:hypothetical protein
MKRLITLSLAGSFTALMMLACSGDDGAAVITVDQACAGFADAVCAKVDSCYATAIRIAYGSVEVCKTRQLIACKAAASAPSTAITTDKIQTCAAGQKNATCGSLYRSDVIAECPTLAGTLGTGAPCYDNAQCQSAFCGKAEDANCGTCQAPPAAGGACVGGKCPSGLHCDESDKCTKPASSGQKCTGNDDCQSDLTCNAGSCGTPAKAGEGCSLEGKTAPACDRLAGLWCNVKSNKCEAYKAASGGAPCGLDAAAGTLTLCDASAYCQTTDAATFKGTCLARPADGAACKDDALGGGTTCVPPAVCEGGTCKAPDSAVCK